MNYIEAMEFLEETKKYGSQLGLTSIRNLMAELGNVQDEIPLVHIGGTNGKGSVGAMLSQVLAESGYKVGRFCTPDVFAYEDEFQMNGINIEIDRLAQLFTKVKEACDKLIGQGKPHPTRFEVETAAAFLWFYEENCDIALLEVGMGGETDATNLIRQPLVSVLTSISMDHIRFLGNSLSEIATAKSGIIKPQIPVVTMEQQPEAFAQIKKKAEAVDAELIVARADQAQHITQKNGRYAFAWNVFEGVQNEKTDGTERTGGADRSSRELQIDLSLCGAFQVENAVCVLNVLQILQKKYPKITKATIQHGLAHTTWHGRLERLGTEPDFYLDGAHNEDAVRKLRKTLEEGFSDRRIVYIMGVLADKDYEKMIRMMFRPGDHVYTVTPQNPRALDGKELEKQLLEQKIAARYCENVQDAVLYALRDAQKDDMILAFGSLSYLRNVREAYESVMIALEQEKIDL
ncbi:folylpolyglutamate synthase/dihydrofolate synthase family protein [uncultured Eubacterium sp.]|uniref:bifunctional folylpolyglutamate synthase/dihydrofolate synthase n=1 Tax=uncultured Eubacterium sp. TaxID=165185 RepID=UPI0025D91F14|nr:folylpolyglutamate synthase/dihydrofolate synthase family protein [uncultured Eubacterium sp.]MCI6538368.1 bifunctional folylpolyglutamate synthase/dihydrofolate synthase [Lachnospiraceae bacterium]